MSRRINVSVLLALQMQNTEIFFSYIYIVFSYQNYIKYMNHFRNARRAFGQLLRFLRIWILSKSNQK